MKGTRERTTNQVLAAMRPHLETASADWRALGKTLLNDLEDLGLIERVVGGWRLTPLGVETIGGFE